MRLGHDIISLTGKADLGLRMGMNATPALMGLAGFTAACAATLKQALIDMAFFETLSSKNARGQSRFIETGQHGIAQFYSVSPYNDFNFFIVDLALSVQFKLVQTFSNAAVMPNSIDIEFKQPAYAECYADYFPCAVRFGQLQNALVYNLKKLNQPTALANPVTYQECRLICEQQKKTAQQTQTFLQ